MRRKAAITGYCFLLAYFAYLALLFWGPASELSALPAFALLGVAIALILGSALWPRTRSEEHREAVEVAPPVSGEWIAVNSPADRVPSHGVHGLGQEYAIDVFMDSGRPLVDGWWPAMRRPDDGFPAFGRPILAVADATVVHVSDGQRDHLSRNSWPGLLYLHVIEGIGRSIGGARRIFGNHVVLDLGDGVHAAYAHLKQGSIEVAAGDRVTVGQRIALCGNSGNSSEPHLHFQLMDHPRIAFAKGVPFTWTGVGVPSAGEPFHTPAPDPS
ncbi:M23 family metallopeptidase [Nocardiopsis ganjiahuensis]|uniref:M23 family metallopeptidase n=1 Tax=Nocardiopsis ganjiahuensis TaxID=239984 RepID=UPI0003491B54|nr:M23 family metallopeptidase [Nocardiopsis ganjiahuensis]